MILWLNQNWLNQSLIRRWRSKGRAKWGWKECFQSEIDNVKEFSQNNKEVYKE
jgi:hypothetical protein